MKAMQTDGKGNYWNDFFRLCTNGEYYADYYGDFEIITKDEIKYIIKKSGNDPYSILKMIDNLVKIRQHYMSQDLYDATRMGDYKRAENILQILKRKDRYENKPSRPNANSQNTSDVEIN